MKFVLHVITILVVCFVLQYFLPWWTMAIGAAALGYAVDHGGIRSFLAGFIGVGLLWFLMAFYIDYTSHSILTEKVGKILPLNPLILTPVIGGLVGALASLTGALLRPGKKSRVDYYR